MNDFDWVDGETIQFINDKILRLSSLIEELSSKYQLICYDYANNDGDVLTYELWLEEKGLHLDGESYPKKVKVGDIIYRKDEVFDTTSFDMEYITIRLKNRV